MATGKIESYIGFCIRARKIFYGSGAISTLRGGAELIICDNSAAKNTKRMVKKFQNRFNCTVMYCISGFERAVNKEGCKIVALRDKSLAEAIISSADENYKIADERWFTTEN